MNYIEFLKQPGKKIIISDKKSVGNTLRRKANVKDAINTVDVSTKTVFEIAKELVENDLALSGVYTGIKLLDSESASLIISNIVRKNGLSFIKKDCLSIATIKQIYASINTLRMFNKKEAYENNPSDRVKELKKLISDYEKLLVDNKIFDRPLIMKRAIEIVERVTNNPSQNLGFDYYLPWLKKATIGQLESNRLTGIEETFLKKLFNAEKDKKIENITFLPKGGYEEWKNDEKINRKYFKAYGLVNEIEYVINQIIDLKENEKDFSLDKVNILYTSSDYENFLIGCLDMAKLSYKMDRGVKAVNSNMVQILLCLLDWAEADYNYEMIKPIILNNYLTFENVIADKEDVFINPNTEYINSSGKIGWGIDRYDAYYNTIVDSEEKDSTKVFAIFLKEMADIFRKEAVADIYSLMIDFINKYTRKKNNSERRVLMVPLTDQLEVFKYLDTNGLEFGEKIEYIRGFLNNLMVEQINVSSPYINVIKADGFRIIERDYNFILGMSATKFAVNSVNSAILSDEDMKMYLEGDNLPLAEEANQLRILRMRDTLSTISEGSILMGYSYYDTINLRENCASVFFLDLCQDESKIDKIQSYNLYNNEFVPDTILEYENWIKEWTEDVRKAEEERKEEKQKKEEKLEKKIDEKLEEKIAEEEASAKDIAEACDRKEDSKKDIDNNMEDDEDIYDYVSASQLQELLSCPLKYYYHNIRKITVDSPLKRAAYQWLPANEKGNLYHHTYEKYMKEYFPPKRAITSDWDDIKDRENLRKFYDAEIEELKRIVPATSDYIVDKETEENWGCLLEYMKRLHNEWFMDKKNGKEWLLLGCELAFRDDVKETIEYEDKAVLPNENSAGNVIIYASNQYPYKLLFNKKLKEDGSDRESVRNKGSIDRLDAYIDKNDTIHLRIVDYKTGSISKKIEEINEDKWIQHYVYAMAAIAYVNNPEVNEKLCKLFNVKAIKELVFDNIIYSFPLEVLNASKKSDMEIDVLIKEGDDALANHMVIQKKDDKDVDEFTEIHLKQDKKNPLLWSVEFSDNVKDIFRSTLGSNQEKRRLKKTFDNKLSKENASDEDIEKLQVLLREIDCESRESIYIYIKKQLDQIMENDSFSKTEEKALAKFCNYCNYQEVCRMHAGQKVRVGEEIKEETEEKIEETTEATIEEIMEDTGSGENLEHE